MKVNPYYPLRLVPSSRLVDQDREDATEFVDKLVSEVSKKLEVNQITSKHEGSFVGKVTKYKADLYEPEPSSIYKTISASATRDEDLRMLSRSDLEALVTSLRKELKYYKDLSTAQTQHIATLRSENDKMIKSKPVSSKSFIVYDKKPLRDESSFEMLRTEMYSSNSPSPVKERIGKYISKDSVPYEDYEFWKSSEDKNEPDPNCFQDLAQNKELWIVNAENMLKSQSPGPNMTTKSGIKANALTRSPVLRFASKDKLGYIKQKNPILSNRGGGNFHAVSRQVQLINQYTSQNPRGRTFN
jgi:hypothetical protein